MKMGSFERVCWAHGDAEYGPSFSCPNGHTMCGECVGNMTAEAIPQKCPHPNCGAHIDHVKLRQCIPVERQHIFDEKILASIERAAPLIGEKTRKCPQCRVFMAVDSATACGGFHCQYQYACLAKINSHDVHDCLRIVNVIFFGV